MKIWDLQICREHRFVEGEGPLDADIMLVGQNPGAKENRTGRPFVGRAGQYLDKVLEQSGMKRNRIYITSIVKCKTLITGNPPGMRSAFPFLIWSTR